MREFLFGKSVGDWKRKNPLRFALLIIGAPSIALLLLAGPFDAMTFALVVGIWIVVAILVVYLPLKLMYWLQQKLDR